jgi:membrane-bound lytic murein transglycosylase D
VAGVRLKPNETLPQVASRYSMSVETLRAVNGIGSRSVVPVGHTLLVPAQQPSREAAETLTHAVFTTVPSGRTFYYVVQRGDTLQRVASRYGVTVAEIKQWNGIVHERVQPGTRLRVTSDVVPVAKGGRTLQARAGDARRDNDAVGEGCPEASRRQGAAQARQDRR